MVYALYASKDGNLAEADACRILNARWNNLSSAACVVAKFDTSPGPGVLVRDETAHDESDDDEEESSPSPESWSDTLDVKLLSLEFDLTS